MKVNNNKTDWHSIAQILPRATEKDTFQGERKILVMKRTRSINEFKKKPECFCLFTDGGFMGSFVYCESLGWRKSVGVKTNRPRLLRRSSLEIKSRRRSGNATCGIMSHCDRITPCNAHQCPSTSEHAYMAEIVSLLPWQQVKETALSMKIQSCIARPWQPLVL